MNCQRSSPRQWIPFHCEWHTSARQIAIALPTFTTLADPATPHLFCFPDLEPPSILPQMHLAPEETQSVEESDTRPSTNATFVENDEELFRTYNADAVHESSGWGRWLLPEFPKELHDNFLGYFFSYINPFTLFLDEARFYRDLVYCCGLERPWAATAFYSPLLHNVLLALGSKYDIDPRAKSAVWQMDANGEPVQALSSADVGLSFAQNAARYFEQECAAPTLSTVIGCMLMGTYHHQSARPTLGWIYEGIGVRLANVLGLHMDSTDLVARGVVSPELKRARDYCWATVAFQDKLWWVTVIFMRRLWFCGNRKSASDVRCTMGGLEYHTATRSYTQGRFPSVRSSDVENVHPPQVSASMDAAPWYSFPRRTELPGLRSTVMHHTALLTGIAERIHTLNYSMRMLSPAKYTLARSQLYLELTEWRGNLPASCSLGSNVTRSVTPHIINLNVMGWYMVLLLFRTHFRPQREASAEDEEETPESICLSASTKIMALLRIWQRQHGLRTATPSLANITFCAGTIFVLAAANDQPNQSKRTREAVENITNLIAM